MSDAWKLTAEDIHDAIRVASLAANMVTVEDLERYLADLDRAMTFGPFFDPSEFLDGSKFDHGRNNAALVRAFLVFRREIHKQTGR